jgi:hypothetical protein
MYLDLDFYCHNPFLCLDSIIFRIIEAKLQVSKQRLLQHKSQVDLLIVSREPLLHALFFKQRPRVVIQDFYLATRKHPLLHWILEELKHQFVAQNFTIAKGPVSYTIDQWLNRYYSHRDLTILEEGRVGETGQLLAYSTESCQQLFPRFSATSIAPTDIVISTAKSGKQNTSSSNSSRSSRCEIIIELSASVLHPLLDDSNARLYTGCRQFLNRALKPSLQEIFAKYPSFISKEEIPKQLDRVKQQCQRFLAGKPLSATNDTTLVHMWTHSFLGMLLYLHSIDYYI